MPVSSCIFKIASEAFNTKNVEVQITPSKLKVASMIGYTKSNNTLWVAPVSIKKQIFFNSPEDNINGNPIFCIPYDIEKSIFLNFNQCSNNYLCHPQRRRLKVLANLNRYLLYWGRHSPADILANEENLCILL